MPTERTADWLIKTVAKMPTGFVSSTSLLIHNSQIVLIHDTHTHYAYTQQHMQTPENDKREEKRKERWREHTQYSMHKNTLRYKTIDATTDSDNEGMGWDGTERDGSGQ